MPQPRTRRWPPRLPEVSFNGQTERDTSYYSYRWVNNQGAVIYTDENSFDPNIFEEYKTREWKRTPTRKR